MINRFVQINNAEEPKEIVSANDDINNYLLHIETMGCGIKDMGGRPCEDFGCSSIIEIIELMELEAR